MKRSRQYRRKQRQRVINRKKNIIRNQNNYWHYEHEGVLSKGKIHCSCWMCRNKSYDRTKMQDAKNIIKALDSINECGVNCSKDINKISSKLKIA